MQRKSVHSIIMALASFALFACGGGGGGGEPQIPDQDTVVAGVASKGPISGGTVKVYELKADGTKGQQLGKGGVNEARTDAQGNFSLNIGSFRGAILIEAYGDYTDEATGAIRSVNPETPLRAVVSGGSPELAMAVTPLSELAVRLVGQGTSVQEANKKVGDIFKVDLAAVLPAAPVDSVNAPQAAREYMAILATLSQTMNTNGKSLDALVAELSGEILQHQGLSGQTVQELGSAAQAFFSGANNRTGLTTPPTVLQQVGTISYRILLKLEPTASPDIGALDLSLQLPVGFAVEIVKTSNPGLQLASNLTEIAGGRRLDLSLFGGTPIAAGNFLEILGSYAGADLSSQALTITSLDAYDQNAQVAAKPTVSLVVTKQ